MLMLRADALVRGILRQGGRFFPFAAIFFSADGTVSRTVELCVGRI